VVDPRRLIYHPAAKRQYFCDVHHEFHLLLVHMGKAVMSAIQAPFISTSRPQFAQIAHIFV
jgi:hypothetical protein